MTWIELSPELIANLESYTQMEIIRGYIWIGIGIIVIAFLLVIVFKSLDDF